MFVTPGATKDGDGSAANPFATLGAAQQAWRAGRGSAREPLTVKVAAGDLYLETEFRLDERDSNVRFEADGAVRLMRAEKATPGTRVACDAPPPPDAEGFARQVAHAPLFFYDGKWAVEARWPNEGFATFTNVVDTGLTGRCLNSVAPDNAPAPGAFVVESDRPSRWNYADGVRLAGYFTHDWAYEVVRAAGFDPTGRVMRLAAGTTFGVGGQTWSARTSRRFYAFGLREELDAPGEYFYDRKTGVVDFIAPPGMKEFLAVTKPGSLVFLSGADNVTFDGFAFEYALGDGLTAKNCRGLRIVNCRVRNLGGNGIGIFGGADCRVVRTEVSGCGLCGVSLSGGDRRTLTRAEHRVEDCDISDYGRVRRTYATGVQFGGCGITVARCRISDAPHTGILYGGNEHLIESNEIHHILYEVGDAGAIYTGRDPTSRGNVVRFNFIHDCGERGLRTANVMGIYVDDCDAGDLFVSNRVVNVPRGMLIGGGQDNRAIGNVFEDCDVGLSIDDRGTYENEKWDNPKDPSWQMTRKVKEMPVAEEPWRSRYPLLVNYLEDGPREPRHVVIADNTFVRCDLPIEYWLKSPTSRGLLDVRGNRVIGVSGGGFSFDQHHGLRLPCAGLKEPVRFWVIADSHLNLRDERDAQYAENCKWISGEWGGKITCREAFLKLLKEAKAEKPDLLVMAGDMINFPTLANVEFAKRELDACGVPWIYVAGNHDWHLRYEPGKPEDLRKKWTSTRLAPLYQGANPQYASRVVKGVRFVMIDNSLHNVTPEQTEFFRAEAAKGDPVCLVMHIPFWHKGWGFDTCACPNWEKRDRTWEIKLLGAAQADQQDASTFAFRAAVESTPNLVGVFAGHMHRWQFAQDPSAVHVTATGAMFGECLKVTLTSNDQLQFE